MGGQHLSRASSGPGIHVLLSSSTHEFGEPSPSKCREEAVFDLQRATEGDGGFAPLAGLNAELCLAKLGFTPELTGTLSLDGEGVRHPGREPPV